MSGLGTCYCRSRTWRWGPRPLASAASTAHLALVHLASTSPPDPLPPSALPALPPPASQTNILGQLTRALAEHAPALAAATEAAAELDATLALAAAARELRLTRPVITHGTELIIKGGRHPLTELVCDSFIPNNTEMLEDSGRIQVVTGPNYSGKSVYSKQVALVAYLAHVGSFVPAEEARVGLVDRIFTRVASRETAAVPQSTFMIDLSQLAAMLRLATPRSLCIIDEFGKGTLAADGVGLLCATLRCFAQRAHPPRVVLCTHFSEVLQERLLPRHPQLAFLTMGVVTATPPPAAGISAQQEHQAGGTGDTGEEVVFLYRLQPGHAAPSFGVHCAKLAGISQAVLERAQQLVACRERGAALPARSLPRLAGRVAACAALAPRLAALDLYDGPLVEALLHAACVAAAD